MNDYTDPLRTLALLDELQTLGLSDKAFSIIHHFQKPETIASHRNYCEMLSEEGGRFRTKNNPLVQRRLEMLLAMYKAGGFKGQYTVVWEHLAQAATLEVPPDERPLSEQLA
jgi:hypothetical protein